MINADALVRADVLNCLQQAHSADRLAAALVTRVLGDYPIHGALVAKVSERATWTPWGSFGVGIALGERLNGLASSELPSFVGALRETYLRLDDLSALPAQFETPASSTVHLFGLHEPVFGSLAVISDASVEFSPEAALLLRHASELCLSRGNVISHSPVKIAVPGATDESFFSDRQLEVLDLLRQGMSNTEIGRKLSISASLAKQEVAFLMHSLGAKNRLEVVVKAQQQGLLPVQAV